MALITGAPICFVFGEQIFLGERETELGRAGPRSWGSVEAARQCTIAPQRGDGDWEASIRDVDPVSPQGCAQPGTAFMEWRNG